MDIFSIVSLVASGLVLVISPIPYLSVMFLNEFKKQQDRNEPLYLLVIFVLFNGLHALLPIALIIGAFSLDPIGGLLFTAIMYYPYWSSSGSKEANDN